MEGVFNSYVCGCGHPHCKTKIQDTLPKRRIDKQALYDMKYPNCDRNRAHKYKKKKTDLDNTPPFHLCEDHIIMPHFSLDLKITHKSPHHVNINLKLGRGATFQSQG